MRGVMAATAAVLVMGIATAPASAQRSCGRVVERDAYGSISGGSVHIQGPWGCPQARKVLSHYFRMTMDSAQTDGGCAQKRTSSYCRVGAYRCRTRQGGADGRSLVGTCTHATQRVRFVEVDRFYG